LAEEHYFFTLALKENNLSRATSAKMAQKIESQTKASIALQ